MRLPKDLLSQTYIKPRIFLCEVDKERICQLETTNTSAMLKFNSYSELSFEVGRIYNNIITGEVEVNPYYDKIEALRLIELEGFGYFEIQGPEIVGDGIKESKSITAYGFEYTLSQKYLKNFYTSGGRQWVGSLEQQWKLATYGSDDNNKPTKPITLYNPSDTKASLLHLVLSEVYGWSIGHVDASLCTLSRQFDIDRESVYDFLMNEVCEKFNCYIVFDTYDNTINVYAESLTAKFIGDGKTNTFIITPPFEQVGTVSVDGYKTTRWQYNSTTGTIKLEEVPETGAHIEVIDNALTKWETDVFVSFDNLSQEINVSYDADSIKTKLDVTYGDDHDIREVNLGVPYLIDLSYYYTVDWMGQDLYDAYTTYMQKSNALQSDYANNSQEILKLNDQIYDLKNRLSLVYGMDSSVNAETVGTYYIVSGGTYPNYSYTEVSLPSEWNSNATYYKIDGVNVTEEKVHKLYSAIRKYFVELMGQEEPEIKDIASTNGTYADLLDDLTETKAFDFVSSEFNKLKNALTLTTTKEDATAAVSNFLKLIWNELGLTPLEQLFLAPYMEVKEANVSAGFSSTDNKHYGFYYPVNIMIDSLNDAIKERQEEIAPLDAEKTKYENNNKQIADDLLMNKNFTLDQLVRLSAFMREDELHIDDIIETSQDDLDSSFKTKQDAMESGRIELQKICQPQLQFAMTMANIYALPEFEPIVHQFQLGNVIKVALRPDYIKQSRLLQVDINFDDFSDFSCEFGELTSLRSQSDIHADLLKNAISAGKSVATNSGHWTKGSDVATAIDLKIQQGLLDATTRIQATDGSQGVAIDKYGIWLTKSNPDGSVSPYQARIVNNNMLFSSDGFKTSRMGIGEFLIGEGENEQTFYGVLAEALVGRLIIGTQLEIGNNAGTMNFNDDGLTVTNNINTFNVNPDSQQLLTISKKTNDKTEDIFYVDENGKLHISGDGAGLDITSNSSITGLKSQVEVAEGRIGLIVSDSNEINVGSIVAAINDDNESEIAIKADKIKLEGAITANEKFQIDENGSMVATGGKIANWNIDDSSIHSDNATFDGTSGMYFGTQGLRLGDNFKVDINGNLTAKGDASFTGKIIAKDGEIANWNINESSIYTNDGTFGNTTGMYFGTDGLRIGSAFKVDANGNLTATGSASFTGKITSNDGEIAGFKIDKTAIYKGTNSLTSTTSGIYVGTDGIRTVGSQGNVIHSSDYSKYKYNNSNSQSVIVSPGGVEFYETRNADGSGYISSARFYYNGVLQGTIDGAWGIFCKNQGVLDWDSNGYFNTVKVNNGLLVNEGIELNVMKCIYTSDSNYSLWLYNGTTAINKWGHSGSIRICQESDTVGDVTPGKNNTMSLGRSNYKWSNIYAHTSTIDDSDRNMKDNIKSLADVHEQFFMKLLPVSFTFKNGTSGRTHIGFISQDVESVMGELGMTSLDFAGFCKDIKMKPTGNGEEEEPDLDKDGNMQYIYSLRYGEFIALNTYMIQKNTREIESLKLQIQELKSLVEKSN